jgi:thymidine kinase
LASLHYVFAPMNASKSAQLLMVAHNYEESGKSVYIVKPLIDTRDGEYVRSRALSVSRHADAVIEKDEDIFNIVFNQLEYGVNPLDVVLVDEAQFLTAKQVDNLSDIVDLLDVPVMAYGLKTDFNGNLFEGSKRLLEVSDKFQELKTICPCCGGKAIINMRMDGNEPMFDGEQVSPGTHYQPVCRKYFKELRELHGHQG